MEKITIITVTYNCVNDVERTILDALSLDYPNYEVLVIDGASEDGTTDILEKCKDQFAYYVSEPDKGIYDAMNKGVDHATGDWIIFLNVGDIFDGKDVLQKVFYRSWDGIDVIFGDGQVIYADGQKYQKPWGPFWESKKIWHGMGFSHQSVFVRSELAKRYPFDLSFRCCADYNMMVTIYNNGGKFYYIPVSITIREGRNGFSERNRFIQMKEEARICGVEDSIYFKYRYLKHKLSAFVRKNAYLCKV